MASAADNRRGIVFMLTAMTLFVGNDTLMKLAREVFPSGQAVALRSVFAIMAGFALVVVLGDRGKLRLGLQRAVLWRGLVEAAIAVSFVWSLGRLQLADITAITQASPLIIVLLAVAMRIEVVGWRRSLAIAIGFIGVLIVVQPGTEGFDFAAVVALASAVLVGVRDLMTRSIGKQVPSTVVSLASTAIVGLVAFGSGLGETWVGVLRVETLYLALAAVLVSGGSFFVIGAFRGTDVSVVAGFRYAVVVIALAVGYAVWGDVPNRAAMVGIVLIVASGLYTMHRQQVRPDRSCDCRPRPCRDGSLPSDRRSRPQTARWEK